MIRTVSRYMNDLYTHKVSRKLKDSLIPSPTRAELSWSHFTGSKMPLAARKNHTHTDELDIQFLKESLLTHVCLKNLTFGMILKKS